MEPTIWQILLNILVHSNVKTIVVNCLEALHTCLDGADEEMKEEFTMLLWGMLPNVLSKALIDDCDTQIGMYESGNTAG